MSERDSGLVDLLAVCDEIAGYLEKRADSETDGHGGQSPNYEMGLLTELDAALAKARGKMTVAPPTTASRPTSAQETDMSERAWTPGPYILKQRPDNGMIGIHTQDGTVIGVLADPAHGGPAEWRENAVLFRAAPALYEALSECVEYLLEERRAFVRIHAVPPDFAEASIEGLGAADLAEMDERIAKARAALAAAEGGS